MSENNKDSNAAKMKNTLKKGIVVSDKMNKTIVVKIQSIIRHPVYKKVMKHARKVKVHDEKNLAKIGDEVKIIHGRPVSKDKQWRLSEITKKHS